MKGKLVIISAPSGAGKTTIVKNLITSGLKLSFSISVTTRPARGNEKNGIDYFYLTVPEFKEKIENDELVEWQEVYKDIFYGTLKSEMERIWKSGKSVLFDVDVKGGINLKNIYRNKSLSIFVMPPSIEELAKRLFERGTDSAQIIKMRINKAAEEITLSNNFDRIIINDNLEKAKKETLFLVQEFY